MDTWNSSDVDREYQKTEQLMAMIITEVCHAISQYVNIARNV